MEILGPHLPAYELVHHAAHRQADLGLPWRAQGASEAHGAAENPPPPRYFSSEHVSTSSSPGQTHREDHRRE